MRSEKSWLRDIVECADEIEFLIQGLDQAQFVTHRAARGAVQYQLLCMGEAATQLPAAFKAAHPAILWKDITAYRNAGIHTYFHINWNLVWNTATKKIPVLRNDVAEILKLEFPN